MPRRRKFTRNNKNKKGGECRNSKYLKSLKNPVGSNEWVREKNLEWRRARAVIENKKTKITKITKRPIGY